MTKITHLALTLGTCTMLVSPASAGISQNNAPVLPQTHYQTIAVSSGNQMATGAENFIQNVASQGLDFLSDSSISKAQQKAEFRELLNENFDLRTIGRFALGRYWNQMNAQQKDEYFDLFTKMVVNSYAERFNEYQGQNLQVTGARKDSDVDTIVNSKINGGQNVRVDWRVRQKDGTYKIVDVLVEGVSMSVTQRSEFSSIIQRGGGNVEALLERLRRI